MATLEAEATTFRQSGRHCWLMTMTVEQLTNIAPSRPAVQLELFTPTNRPINQKHRGEIERFITQNENWALPPITLSAEPAVLKYDNGKLTGDPSALTILDGQHRLEAFHELTATRTGDAAKDPTGKAQADLEAFNAQELAIVIYEVANQSEHRQIFAWFARQRPIEPSVREYFDNSDPFGQAAKTAMEKSKTLLDRITWKTSSLPRRGPEAGSLMTLKQLRETATAIRFGMERAPRKRPNRSTGRTRNKLTWSTT